ncbi:MAG: Rid family hydrolase [Candidatus Paceibacterota bacterium]|jgi:enamine deaminase RidA (YjgF/YER057c/UK114 family)
MIKFKKYGKIAQCSQFINDNGNNEYYISICPEKPASDATALKDIEKSYLSLLKKNNLSEKTQVFCRFYLSDMENQREILSASKIFKISGNGACATIEQCPLNGSRISLLAYHIKGNFKKEISYQNEDKWSNTVKLQGKSYSMIFNANLHGLSNINSEEQTNKIFSIYKSVLKNQNSTLLENSIRTWIYVRDIDNNYSGMVKARREFFAREGLTPQTRFIASTGIEGKPKEKNCFVSMDALSFSKLDEKQIIRISAPSHLNPTHEYGVTFERGTRLDFGDRSHLYISGTASIDKTGKIMYINDVKKQTQRVFENINALMKPHKSSVKDLMYMIVYLRNMTDFSAVKKVVDKMKINDKPIFYVEGAVCRPGWLVEIEGSAIIPNDSKWPKFF